jgi:predicted dehydrogenase
LLRVGLVGCGGRGTGAASQALQADPNVQLVALGDAFADKIEGCLAGLKKVEGIGGKIDVPPERRFVGFEAYQRVIENVDVVLLATPPHFRPIHLRAAIDANKHVFAEKPVAVDAPGVRSVLETCERAREKNLSVVSGLCLRYSVAHQQMMQRLHAGAIGELRVLQANDFRGPIWVRPRQPEWNDMEYQMRNWYYFTWLCGDFNVEQHVHLLDVCSWAMNGRYPVRAVGTGGRQVRTGPEYGNIYDHFSIIYEYADGARLFSHCRQQPGCSTDISARAFGSLGTAEISERRQIITGPRAWETRGRDNNFFQTEHDELFASIRKGVPINNGEYMAKSSLLAIMGRMAAYTGQTITWDEAFHSKEDLSPPHYDWGRLESPSIAIPGVTKFI